MQLHTSGCRAVRGSTWVHAIAMLQAPWCGAGTSFVDAIRWVSTARGASRGWNLQFEGGGQLSCTRRYNSSARAIWNPGAYHESPLKVQIANGPLQPGFVVVPPK